MSKTKYDHLYHVEIDVVCHKRKRTERILELVDLCLSIAHNAAIEHINEGSGEREDFPSAWAISKLDFRKSMGNYIGALPKDRNKFDAVPTTKPRRRPAARTAKAKPGGRKARTKR